MFNNEIAVISGRNSQDYGVYLINGNIFDKPKRVVEYISVPGRSGDLTIDKGRWENIDITYTFAAYDNAIERLQNWIGFLNANIGYQTIKTSLEPEIYRQGVLREISPPQISMTGGGVVDVVFSCKPQRWLKSYEPINIKTTGGAIRVTNPTMYDARPLFHVKAVQDSADMNIWNYIWHNDGTLVTASRYTLRVRTSAEVWVDCETGQAYNGNTNYNQSVYFADITGQDDDIAKIMGNKTPDTMSYVVYTSISAPSGEFATAQMDPRWWTI